MLIIFNSAITLAHLTSVFIQSSLMLCSLDELMYFFRICPSSHDTKVTKNCLKKTEVTKKCSIEFRQLSNEESSALRSINNNPSWRSAQQRTLQSDLMLCPLNELLYFLSLNCVNMCCPPELQQKNQPLMKASRRSSFCFRLYCRGGTKGKFSIVSLTFHAGNSSGK